MHADDGEDDLASDAKHGRPVSIAPSVPVAIVGSDRDGLPRTIEHVGPGTAVYRGNCTYHRILGGSAGKSGPTMFDADGGPAICVGLVIRALQLRITALTSIEYERLGDGSCSFCVGLAVEPSTPSPAAADVIGSAPISTA